MRLQKSGQSAAAKPDISVDLNGAMVESGEKTSSRKNVFMISTILGLQVLIQSDNTAVANQWYQEICDVITRLVRRNFHCDSYNHRLCLCVWL